MSTIAISSFSLHRVLGPLRIDVRDEQGEPGVVEIPMPAECTLEEFGALVRDRYGVGAVEVCQIQVADASPSRIAALRVALDDAGVRVLTVPIDVGDLVSASDEHRATDVESIVRWLDVAQALGATYARVNTGSPLSSASGEQRTGLVDALQQLSERAASRNLVLLVENHGGLSSDPEWLLTLQDEVGAERLGILLDLGNFEPLIGVSHARLAGQQVEDTGLDLESVYARIARLAPRAALVHAKALDAASDGSVLLDTARALQIVADAGYMGSISVEWEGVLGDPWERTGAVLSQVREVFPRLT